jgi:hypothetical protein
MVVWLDDLKILEQATFGVFGTRRLVFGDEKSGVWKSRSDPAHRRMFATPIRESPERGIAGICGLGACCRGKRISGKRRLR